MMKMTEREWENKQFAYENTGKYSLQAYVLKRLKEHKPYISVVKVVKANRNGVSDLLLCVRGCFVAIELKVGSNEPTQHQQNYLSEVDAAGGICGVAYTWGDVKRIIKRAGYDIDKGVMRDELLPEKENL